MAPRTCKCGSDYARDNNLRRVWIESTETYRYYYRFHCVTCRASFKQHVRLPDSGTRTGYDESF